MQTVATLKALHLFSGISCFGLLFVIHHMLWRRSRSNSETVTTANAIKLLLKTSFVIDGFVTFFLFNQFLTGTALIVARHYPFSTPWLIAAYLLLTLITLAWLALIRLRLRWYRSGYLAPHQRRRLVTLAWLINIAMILIIHDAIIKQTWLDLPKLISWVTA